MLILILLTNFHASWNGCVCVPLFAISGWITVNNKHRYIYVITVSAQTKTTSEKMLDSAYFLRVIRNRYGIDVGNVENLRVIKPKKENQNIELICLHSGQTGIQGSYEIGKGCKRQNNRKPFGSL